MSLSHMRQFLVSCTVGLNLSSYYVCGSKLVDLDTVFVEQEDQINTDKF